MSARAESPFPRPGSSLALAIATAGPQRAALQAWANWWVEVSRIPYAVSDASVGERKLAWWAQAVSNGFQEAPQHPLLKALMGQASPSELAQVPPIGLWASQIQGLETLLQQTRWLDTAGLEHHMRQTTGAACAGAAWVLGARSEGAQQAAQALGVALRRAHILARLGQDAHAGWLHLPVDFLQQHDVRAHEWLRPGPDAPTPAMLQLMSAWQTDAVSKLQEALGRLQALSSTERASLRPLRVLARLNLILMQDLADQNYPVVRQRISVGPWRKTWAAWLTR
jgi:15-cis-phytoene synthase